MRRFFFLFSILASSLAAQNLPWPAGRLDVRLTSGETTSLESYQDDVVGVLLVNPTGCAACDTGAQTLAAVQQELAAQGVRAIAVAVDTGADPQAFAAATAEFAARVGVAYPVGMAAAEEVSAFLGREDAFGGRTPTALPDLVILGPGLITWEEQPFGSGGRTRGGASNSAFWTDAETNMRASFEERIAAAGAPVLYGSGVLDAASSVEASIEQLSVGSIISIYGVGLAGNQESATVSPLPTEIDGVQVMYGDVALPLFFVSPGQINAQLPYYEDSRGGGRGRIAQAGPSELVVVNGAGASNAIALQLTNVGGSIYTLNRRGDGQGFVVHADTGALAAPAGTTADSRPAKAGDVVTIYANSLGAVTPDIEAGRNACEPDSVCLPDFSNLTLRTTLSTPLIRIGTLANSVLVPAENILFSGLTPQFAGLYQVNLILPEGIPTGDAVPIGFVTERARQRMEAVVTMAVE